MDEKDIPPKIRKEIMEHLVIVEYALFYINYLLKEVEKSKSNYCRKILLKKIS